MLVTRVRTMLVSAATRSRALAERARAEQAEAHAAELSALAAALSHDVIAPLNVIQRTLDLVTPELPPERAQRIVATAQDRLTSLRQLATALLGWLRAGHDTSPVSRRPVAAWVDDAWELVGCPAPFTLVVENGEVELAGREATVRSTLTNVLRNCVVHHDQAEGEIWVTARGVGGGAEITIADDGPGIPEGLRRAALLLFVKGDDGGTGVGLASVARSMRESGGEIAIEPNSPRGTRIHLQFPAPPTER